ncbi:KTSC domain-containing protein [Neorhizobium alkalisoli]|uniref:KTSC domain-containing protein n=1 Tax=Neorhizobium alkalisoli TaxID=528178 RepID=A0A561QSE2_9HYPH|nr:KTSC domain-containing protein [Neorhizobium alkalisoli]TWF53303.1 KTSC domain-containing protein [Neorhizobium alkalisoli]
MPNLKSSAIGRAEYNDATSTLSIWFVESGGPYDYYHVPEQVYIGLINARSAGSYFNDYIRDRYSSNR